MRSRRVKAVHAVRRMTPDPAYEVAFAQQLRAHYSREALVKVYARWALGESAYDFIMRRVIWRALACRLGHGVQIGSYVGFKHLETFEIGDGVFIGAQSYLQGRFDGRCVIGHHVWVGPQSYFDARDLLIEDYVGWGPGAKVLGSTHTGRPSGVPLLKTDLEIKPVRIRTGADIGMNAVILPGVTVEQGSIVGAGAVVTKDVPAFAVVAGVPARFLHWRTGYEDARRRH